MQEQPGLIKNTYGAGTVYYFGAAFSEETAEVFLEKLGVKDPYKAKAGDPGDLRTGRKKERRYRVLLRSELQRRRSRDSGQRRDDGSVYR